MPAFLNPEYLIPAFGLLGIFFILILEAGLLIGVFLPGDSLLFAAGIFVAKGVFDPLLLITICFFGTLLGDQLGYYLGKKYGKKIFSSEKSLFFNKSHLEKTEHYFKKYGNKTVLIARFIPIIRTGVPTSAGVGNMDYKKFLIYNTIGAFIWTVCFISLGYFAGKVFKGNVHILGYSTLVIIFLSVLWALVQMFQLRHKNNKGTTTS